MTKLLLLSDLHKEFDLACSSDQKGAFRDIPDTKADLVILAGDIDLGVKGIEWAKVQSQRLGLPVVYVMGNHEYYGHGYTRLLDEARELALKGDVHLLERDEVLLEGVRILGCTLWTDFGLRARTWSDAKACEDRLNDFRRIQIDSESMMNARYMMALHHQSRQWLAEQLARHPETPTVVVTHYAPHYRSLSTTFLSDPLSAGFVADCADLLAMPNLTTWVHGHLHSVSDYEVDGTHVICNPRGYFPDHLVPAFLPGKVVSVEQPGRNDE